VLENLVNKLFASLMSNNRDTSGAEPSDNEGDK
jgi:hypothetical protein